MYMIDFLRDIMRGLLFRLTGLRTDRWGGYILTRPRARRLDNILCGLPND